MLETILEAAARVFVKEGYARATTNRIAAAAGISVGSLYQYFPGKDAIAVALLRRHRDRILEGVASHLADVDEASLEVRVRELVRAVLAAEGLHPGLHRVLIEQVLRTGARAEMIGFEDQLEAVIVERLKSQTEDIGVKDLDLAAFISRPHCHGDHARRRRRSPRARARSETRGGGDADDRALSHDAFVGVSAAPIARMLVTFAQNGAQSSLSAIAFQISSISSMRSEHGASPSK